MNEETEKKINQLQLIEQNTQQSGMQRQQFKAQLNEVTSALAEIEKTPQAYKIVGNIMVMTTSEDLKKDLSAKKEILELRIKTLEKQEQHLREKAETLRSEVMEKMEKQKT